MCYDISCGGDITMADFENKLKRLRKEKKLNQSEVAEDLGIARTTYANYEQGKRFPGQENLIAIAEYFRVSIDYLLGEIDEKISKNKIIAEISKDEELLECCSVIKNNKELMKLIIHLENITKDNVKYFISIVNIIEKIEKNN